MRPILDLPTALHVDADLPVGTGVMRAYTFGLQSVSDWRTHRPEDHVIVLRAVPTLRLLNRGTGPFSDAFLFLMHILQNGDEDLGLQPVVVSSSWHVRTCMSPQPSTSWLSSSGIASGPQACRTLLPLCMTTVFAVLRTSLPMLLLSLARELHRGN